MQATIQNEFLSLTVDTHGAEAVSLKNAAGEELLWQADPAVWKRHAPILFPWTGKLKDGSFTHGGKTYKGGQHGFARDVEHTLLKAEGDTIQLELRPDEAMKAEKFPFDFVLTSTFRLDGKTLHHTLTVSNPGAEELRFGIQTGQQLLQAQQGAFHVAPGQAQAGPVDGHGPGGLALDIAQGFPHRRRHLAPRLQVLVPGRKMLREEFGRFEAHGGPFGDQVFLVRLPRPAAGQRQGSQQHGAQRQTREPLSPHAKEFSDA